MVCECHLLGCRRSTSWVAADCLPPPLLPRCHPIPRPPGPSCIELSSTCSRLVNFSLDGSTMLDLGGRLTAVQPSSQTPAAGGPPALAPVYTYTHRYTSSSSSYVVPVCGLSPAGLRGACVWSVTCWSMWCLCVVCLSVCVCVVCHLRVYVVPVCGLSVCLCVVCHLLVYVVPVS